MTAIRSYKELDVYRRAMDLAMDVFKITSGFPSQERYSLVDQIRRSSRSVCANIAEAWRKRRYKAAFVSRLSDAETEAAETQVWIEFSHRCGYIDDDSARRLDGGYDHVIAQLITIMESPDKWIIRQREA
jgi:four helix bundle protein